MRKVETIPRDLPQSLRPEKCGDKLPFPTEEEFKAAGDDQPWTEWSAAMINRDECMTGLVEDIWTWSAGP